MKKLNEKVKMNLGEIGRLCIIRMHRREAGLPCLWISLCILWRYFLLYAHEVCGE